MNLTKTFLRTFATLLSALLLVSRCNSAASNTGAEIYTEMCASCHGSKGEGIAGKHDEPLYGDRSLKSLTRVIERTMPEDDPSLCVGEDAEKVAAYIYDSFYSSHARAKLSPPRIGLARLTVSQYQNTIADLLGSFRNQNRPGSERGLRGTYYNSHQFKDEKKAFERRDPQIRFAFDEGAPVSDTNKIGVEEFAIQWRGSVIAEETGDYEFCLKTENGAKLFVNDDSKPLIDAWVSSGGEIREHRETIRLLGHRAYSIRVDYFKFKDKTASLDVQWKPPLKTIETIPNRNLSPDWVPPVMVLKTTFPPDDGSAGYERGTTVSKAWDRATTYAAVEVAEYVIDNLERLSGVKDDAPDKKERYQEFSRQFAERAFRRPLSEEQKEKFVNLQFENEGDLKAAVKRMVLLVLKSPHFLYPDVVIEAPDAYSVASRLSFTMWDSLPDAELLNAAAKDELITPEQVNAQAMRMLKDLRAKSKMAHFFHHWLELEEAEEISKDPLAFPDFTDQVLADLKTSLEMFIDEVVWSDRSNYQDLLLADYLYLTPRLAKFYGAEQVVSPDKEEPALTGSGPDHDATESKAEEAEIPSVSPLTEQQFEKYVFEKNLRTGVLTHPYLLTAFAYYKSSSPIHRGVFLTRNIVGRSLRPPPAAIQFMDGRFDPSLTMREKVTELTKSDACMGCHVTINPLGFSLENFDGVGRFRTMDNGKPVDSISDYITSDGNSIPIKGARDVAEHAVQSEEAQSGFVRQLFHQMVKQPVQAYGAETVSELQESFAASDFNIQRLMVEIATRAALHGVDQSKTNIRAER